MSNNVFDETVEIEYNKVDSIVDEFKEKIIEPYLSDYIYSNKIKGLGSTRQCLKISKKTCNILSQPGKIHLLPTELDNGTSGDIDLIVLLKDNLPLKKSIQEILSILKENQIKAKTFFGNILSICFYTQYKSNPVQIDLMFADNKLTYDYLYNLKFYSGESLDGKYKGLHRTELIRSLVKYKGLSLGMNGFKRFKWNNEFDSINDIQKELKNKFKRARTNKSKLTWMLIKDWLIIKNFNSLSNLKNYLCYSTDYLQNRLYIDSIINVKGNKEVIRKLRKILFVKEDLSYIDWKFILKKYLNFNINNIKLKGRLNKFKDILKLIKDMKYKEYILYDYKNELKSKPKNYFDVVEREVMQVYEMDA